MAAAVVALGLIAAALWFLSSQSGGPDKASFNEPAAAAPDFGQTKAKAEQGDAAAQYNLGMLYEAGQGTALDYTKAAEWYRKAAEQGHPAAQYSLAVMYVYARGVEANDQEALTWLKRAAEQGEPMAQYALGERYLAGTGVPKDLVAAYKWFALAADQDVPDATKALDQIKPQMNRNQIAEGRQRARQFAPKRTAGAP